jgi:DNA-directed RNA polymerase specialized sigma24 family protein
MNESASFTETRWTLVLRSQGDSPEARSALSELCESYYEPVRVFIERSGCDSHAVRDLTHEFFAHVLANQNLRASPHRGRFRAYLLGAVKHFLSDQRDRERALKRGGGLVPVSLDAGTETSPGLEIADPSSSSPDYEYDRRWALTVVDRSILRVAGEFAAAGKTATFEALKPWLTGDLAGTSQSAAAGVLGISDGAVKVAIHRLRERFREAVRSEIAQTVESAADIKVELNYLLSVL